MVAFVSNNMNIVITTLSAVVTRLHRPLRCRLQGQWRRPESPNPALPIAGRSWPEHRVRSHAGLEAIPCRPIRRCHFAAWCHETPSVPHADVIPRARARPMIASGSGGVSRVKQGRTHFSSVLKRGKTATRESVRPFRHDYPLAGPSLVTS